MAYEFDDRRYYPSVGNNGRLEHVQAYPGDARTARMRDYLELADEEYQKSIDPRTELAEISRRLDEVLAQQPQQTAAPQPRTIGRFLSELTSTLGTSDIADFPAWLASLPRKALGTDQMTDEEQIMNMVAGVSAAPRMIKAATTAKAGGTGALETLKRLFAPIAERAPAEVDPLQTIGKQRGLQVRRQASQAADEYGLDPETRYGLAQAFAKDKSLPNQVLNEPGNAFELGIKDPYNTKARANETAEYYMNKVLEAIDNPAKKVGQVAQNLANYVDDLMPTFGQQLPGRAADIVQDAGRWASPKITEIMDAVRGTGLLEKPDRYWYSKLKNPSRERYGRTGPTEEQSGYWSDRAAREGTDFEPLTQKDERLWQRPIAKEFQRGASISEDIKQPIRELLDSETMKNFKMWAPEIAALVSLPFLPTMPVDEYQEKPGLGQRDMNNPEGIPAEAGATYRPNSWWEVVSGR